MLVTKRGTTSTTRPSTSVVDQRSTQGDVAITAPPSEKNRVWPSLARRRATSAALIGAMLVSPCHGLLGHIGNSPNFVEVACAPASRLSEVMEGDGFMIKRVNYREGFDLESRQGTSMLQQEVTLHPPRFMWISLPCTRIRISHSEDRQGVGGLREAAASRPQESFGSGRCGDCGFGARW